MQPGEVQLRNKLRRSVSHGVRGKWPLWIERVGGRE